MEIVDGIESATAPGTISALSRLLNGRSRQRVLDAPAGRGALTNQLQKLGHIVTPLELDGRNFRVSDTKLLAADLNAQLPVADESFDVVICADGIEHLENPFATVREFERVLAPKGQLIISTPNISAFRSRQRFFLTGFHNKGRKPMTEETPSPWHHINLLTFPQLRYILHRSGFQIESIAANRVKLAALYTALYYPFAAFFTWRELRKEKDERQRELNGEIFRQTMAWPICMGEIMIISATKTDEGPIPST